MNDSRLDLELLEPGSNEGYGNWPLPCQRDEEIAALVHVLTSRGPDELQDHNVPVLLAFAERMATLARRDASSDRLRAGVPAAALASSRGDQRDVLPVLSLLWRTAEVLGFDADAEFRSASGRVGAQALIEFTTRDPKDRAIEAMGYVEVEDELGFHYQRTW